MMVRWMAVLAALVTFLANTGTGRAAMAEATGPAECRVGVVIEELGGFDYAGHAFVASLSFWSVCDSAAGLHVLDHLQFPTVLEPPIRSGQTRQTIGPQGQWTLEQEVVQGRFRHDWRVAEYPFDRQQLTIPFEDRMYGTRQLRFTPDLGPGLSAVASSVHIPGWTVGRFGLAATLRRQESVYGDFTKDAGLDVSRLIISVDLTRDSAIGFLKLTAGALAATLIACAVFFMDPTKDPIYSGRMSLLVGAMFAVLVNLNVAESALGNPVYFTLVGKIHLLSLAFILVSALRAVILRRRFERSLAIAYPNYRFVLILLAVYAAACGTLIIQAMRGE